MQYSLNVSVPQLDASRAALHGLGAGEAVLYMASQLKQNRLCTVHVY